MYMLHQKVSQLGKKFAWKKFFLNIKFEINLVFLVGIFIIDVLHAFAYNGFENGSFKSV